MLPFQVLEELPKYEIDISLFESYIEPYLQVILLSCSSGLLIGLLLFGATKVFSLLKA